MSRYLVLWLIVATSQASAQDGSIDVPQLTLPQAAALVLERNPHLQSAQFGRDAAEAQFSAASMTPQWSVSLDVEDFLGTGSLSGFDGSQSTLRLSRVLEAGGMRAGRMAVASALGNQTGNTFEAERLDTLTLLAKRFVDVVYQQETLRLAEQSVKVWEAARELTLARERAGAAPAVDRLRTEIRVANARLSEENAQHRLKAARMLLAATWGSSTPGFGRAAGSLCRLVDLPPFEVLAARIGQNPDLLRFATEQRLRAAEAQLASARQRPDWSLSAGIRHLALNDDQALVVGVSVPLGSKSRAEPSRRQADALVSQSELQEEAYELAVQATLYDVYQEVLHTVNEVEAFNNEILPKARAIRNEIEEGYGVGRFSHTALLNAQSELLAAAAARIDACADHHRLLIDVERLTGGDSTWLTTDGEDSP
ncbi:MAG: TolC family protein [Gammaproteobacteria bacterium]|nr:TolC family protein [Gammaproteobacteria bacterium]